MSSEIISVPLTKPPYRADTLSSKSNLLVAWQYGGYVSDDDGMKYYLAIHSHVWGWHGYQWNKYGVPWKILPTSKNDIWVYTADWNLICLQIEHNGEASVAANAVSDINKLLDANERGFLVKRREQAIECLHFNKSRSHLSSITLYTGIYPAWAHFLADGAIVFFDSNRLGVLSPMGGEVHKEAVEFCDYFRPFIVRHDNNYLYYTDDPRNGWRKTYFLKIYQGLNDPHATISLFTVLGDECYIALEDGKNNTSLYRFSSETPECVERVWEIAVKQGRPCLAHYNGLICITSPSPISGSGNTDIPKNNGFLAWEPRSNTFYSDIPHTTNIQRISAGRIPTISMPAIWGQNTRKQ